jgi:toxin-antitoxin system PIN domain toxin
LTLADVNVLAAAFRSDAAGHDLSRRWLRRTLLSNARFGLSLQVLAAVLRITTNAKIFNPPSDLDEALEFCASLIDHPKALLIEPGVRHWEILSDLCRSVRAKGNLVSDAWFAALAIENTCEWITFDRDFARFQGLSWSLPS